MVAGYLLIKSLRKLVT